MRFSVSYMAVVAAVAGISSVSAGSVNSLANAIEGDKNLQSYCWKNVISASPTPSTVDDTRVFTSTTTSVRASTETDTSTTVKTVVNTVTGTKTVKTVTKLMTVTAKAKRDEMPTPVLEARGATATPTAFSGYKSAQITSACNMAKTALVSTKTTGSPSTSTSVAKSTSVSTKIVTSTRPNQTVQSTTSVPVTATTTKVSTSTPITKAVYALAVVTKSKLNNVILDDSDLLSQAAGPHVYFGFSTSDATASNPSGMFMTQDKPAQCLAYVQYYQAFGVTDCSNATETTFSLNPSSGAISQAGSKGVTVNSDMSISLGGSSALTWADVNDN